MEPEAKTASHDLMGGNVDSLPSDISEHIARRGRCKQSFVRVNLDCDKGLWTPKGERTCNWNLAKFRLKIVKINPHYQPIP